MIWKPKHLTREQMEERRREGVRLLKTGKWSQAAIARHLAVSRAAIHQWAQQWRMGGWKALRQHKASGRPARLNRAQQQRLVALLKRGALAAGFPTARWTLPRVRQLIEHEFGVRYHVKYLGRLLRRLGWSWQQPLVQATEREAPQIQAWMAQDWPRIKKKRGVWA